MFEIRGMYYAEEEQCCSSPVVGNGLYNNNKQRNAIRASVTGDIYIRYAIQLQRDQ